ncbi:MAG: Cell division protein FtsI [Actinomycetia bacterium]|nr:Cell division protein FtsI [Actinomycetes bacterium]
MTRVVCDPGVMRRLGVVAIVVALVAGAVVFVVARNGGGSGEANRVTVPTQEVHDYLAAWSKHNYPAMLGMVYQPPGTFAAQHQAMIDALGVANMSLTPGTVAFAGTDNSRANATFSAKLTLKGFGPWQYQGHLSLVRIVTTANGTNAPATPGQAGGRWKVTWSPSVLHPQMRLGLAFALTRTWPVRASIVDMNGGMLVGSGDVVDIGVEPQRIKNRAETAAALQQNLGITPAQLDAALVGQQPDWFVRLTTVPRDARYAMLHAVLVPVPGVVFRARSGRIGQNDAFASDVLGTTHEATAEQLQRLGPPYEVGDVVGTSGIEETYERRLAGSPSGKLQLVDATTRKVVAVLHAFTGTPSQPVATTLSPSIQAAADAALFGVSQPAALVAIDVPTGEVRAVANRPLGGFNRALTGHYPPGSTFKVITATAVLGTGANSQTTVTCPPNITVDGATFKNFESETLGTINFHTAFAKSCNTAFVQLAQRAGQSALDKTARSYGFNVAYSTGMPGFGGSYPVPKDRAELAASAFGQGRVDASPVHMASVAAAAAGGQWHAPLLIRGTKQKVNTTVAPIPAAVLPTLHEFMAAVLQPGGTAAASALPGRQIFGKTGTAEFGGGPNPPTHAWFIGYYNNTAFAVIVEGGGVGGAVAAPIGARFVAALP